MKQLEHDIGRVAALADDLRKGIYFFARKSPGGMRREDIAREFGISRKLAAFHLDKLAEKGLLTYHYARLPGRSGPGAGRPPKVYQPSDIQMEVSLPERRYDLVGTLLVDAVQSDGKGGSANHRAKVTSYESGSRLGRQVRQKRRLRPTGAERALSVASDVLEEYGYEPSRSEGEVTLRNCPFHALSQHAPDLVCRMNHAFIEGLVRGLGNDSVKVELAPTAGQCCVQLLGSEH